MSLKFEEDKGDRWSDPLQWQWQEEELEQLSELLAQEDTFWPSGQEKTFRSSLYVFEVQRWQME